MHPATLSRTSQPSTFARAFALLALLFCAGCNSQDDARIFQYDRRQVQAYLQRHGLPKDAYIYQSWQNAAGTKIYFQQDSTSGDVWIVGDGSKYPLRVEMRTA
jgi:hypothetical protein